MFVTFYNVKRLLFLIVILLLSVNALATHVAVLETMADGDAKDSVSLLDRQYLTNVLREQAMKELPAKEGFTIMSRENISAMLPPGKTIEDCEGNCLVETGRNISADYVCQACVGLFGSKLTLSAELYETASNKLIASFNGRDLNVEGLLVVIESKSPDFFHEIKEISVSPQPDMVSESADTSFDVVSVGQQISDSVEEPRADFSNPSVGENIPAHINDKPAKKNGIRWIPLSVSAVVAAVGVTAAIIGNKKAKESSEKIWTTIDEYEKNHQDAKDYQKMRAVGIGFAIAGAVGIGLSFVF